MGHGLTGGSPSRVRFYSIAFKVRPVRRRKSYCIAEGVAKGVVSRQGWPF